MNNLIRLDQLAAEIKKTRRQIYYLIKQYRLPIVHQYDKGGWQPRSFIDRKYINLFFKYRAPIFPHPKLMTITKASDHFCIDRATIFRAIKAHRIKAYYPKRLADKGKTYVDFYQLNHMLEIKKAPHD